MNDDGQKNASKWRIDWFNKPQQQQRATKPANNLAKPKRYVGSWLVTTN